MTLKQFDVATRRWCVGSIALRRIGPILVFFFWGVAAGLSDRNYVATEDHLDGLWRQAFIVACVFYALACLASIWVFRTANMGREKSGLSKLT